MNSMDAMTKGLKMLHQDTILADLMRMNEEYRRNLGYRKICNEIGCSGMTPDMCQNRPQDCKIIRKMTLVEHIAEMNKEKAHENNSNT